MLITRCPRPEKTAHASAHAAAVEKRRMDPSGRHGLSIYRCECGCFHVGHQRRRMKSLRRYRERRAEFCSQERDL